MNIKRQEGMVLIISLIILFVSTILAISTVRTATLELAMSRNHMYATEALQNAESGVAVTMSDLQLNYDLSADGFDGIINGQYRASKDDLARKMWYDTILVDDGEIDGDPTVDSNDTVRLISQGTSFDGASFTIEVLVGVSPAVPGFALDKAILTEGDLTFGGDAKLHGSNQDVHSNSDIHQADKVKTKGDISASGEVYGIADGESNATEIDIPLIDPSVFAQYADFTFDSNGNVHDADGKFVGNNSYKGWEFKGSNWRTVGSKVVGGLLYFEGDAGNVDISSNVGSKANPWEISILADGWIDIGGTPIIDNYKNPANPVEVQQILFMAGTDIKIIGNPNQVFNGIIAAGEQFYLSGNINIEGSILAADQSNISNLVTENTMSGTADIINDGGFSLPPVARGSELEVYTWRELLISQAEFDLL